MADKIQIRMLGEFTLTYQGNVISDQDNRSKKIWTLLEYLITFHKKEISHATLINLLWHNNESNVDPENALKTILHRARTTLDKLHYPSSKLILHHRDNYSWNNDVAYEVDIDQFEHACTLADDPNLPVSERLAHYNHAFQLYKGKFLPKNAEDDWAIPIATYYHSLYIKAVHNMIELLLAAEEYEQVIQICSAAVAIDPYDEPLHFHLIRSLYLTGERKKAIEQYDKVIRMFYDSFGINPSEELTQLYQEIMKEEKSPVADLNIIKEHLREQNAQKTAYLCDYSVFKNLYQIEARSAARSGLSVFLCLITLTSLKPNSDTSLMANAMERMSGTIAQSLRSGDVYARFSVNQYIIMLPSASYENCTTIATRIQKSFANSKPHLNVASSYALSELEPQIFLTDEE
ncbi:MAG: SARP family transcriptional regulator [Lachnospiraceae bacterium]|nr:SARP family transcriptional regulator [Lachnospiraceae bacterium]